MPDLISGLRDRASRSPKRIVYPEGFDPRVIRAAARIAEMRLGIPVLIGKPEDVERGARELGVKLSGIEIVDPAESKLRERYSRILLPEWRSRGVTELEAQKRLE